MWSKQQIFLPVRKGVVQKVALFLLLVLANSSLAQKEVQPQRESLTDWSLDQLLDVRVYSASKFEQKTTEAPSSVTVIPSQEIERYGYRTLADILQSVQGFHVSYDRNYKFLGARGINLGDFNSRVLVLVNGHRINNNLTDGALIDGAFVLDVDLIDRVEVIRGPGSVLYGNNAFFGVINVVTKQAEDVGIEASGEYASFDSFKGRISLGHRFENDLELLVSGTLYDSDGEDELFYKEFNTPGQNRGVARNRDGDSSENFFGTLKYQDFTLQGGWVSREKENPTAQYLTTFNDSRSRTVDERSYVDLKFAREVCEAGDVMARVHYDRNDFEIGYPVAPSLFKEEQTGEWWGTELQYNHTLWERHILTVGAEFRDDFRQTRKTFDAQTGQVFSSQRSDRESHGIFAQADFAVRTNLHFNAGVRYDKYGDFDAKLNPRLAAIYNPVEKSVLKAIYGTAFRTPNFLELSDPRFQNIGSEEITAYELIYEQTWGDYVQSSVSAFYNDIKGLIELQNGRFLNSDANARGLEFQVGGVWPGGVRSRVSYTFQETRSRARSRTLADSPKHLGKLNVSVPIFEEKLFASVEFLFVSSRRTMQIAPDGTSQPGSDAPDYGIVNLTLFSQELIKNLELSASVYNVLDRKYYDPATRFHRQALIEQDGRTFRLKATYRF